MEDWDNWTPTPKNINALPEKLKLYVSSLETLCDPAGIIAENILLKDEMAMFIEALKLKKKEDKECPECGEECGPVLPDVCPTCDFEFLYQEESKETVENPCMKCGKEWNPITRKCCEHCGNTIPF